MTKPESMAFEAVRNIYVAILSDLPAKQGVIVVLNPRGAVP